MTKHRVVAALLALGLFGTIAIANGGDGAEAQTGGLPYIWDITRVAVPEEATKVRFNYPVANGGSEVSQLYFTPLGRTPVKYSFRDLGYAGQPGNVHGVGVLHLSTPAPAGGVTFNYQVVSWNP